MLISKKELLKSTNISYGQLYRWKREGLIPDDWFIKQASFTGQETFFPKNKILNRIQAIQELKNKYSLREVAEIISPESCERTFTVDDLQEIEEIDQGLLYNFCSCFQKQTFTYVELLTFVAISTCKKSFFIKSKDINEICTGIKDYLDEIKQSDLIFSLFFNNGTFFVILYHEQSKVFIDKQIKRLWQIRLNDISSVIKLKYRDKFNFSFDNEKNKVDFFISVNQDIAN